MSPEEVQPVAETAGEARRIEPSTPNGRPKTMMVAKYHSGMLPDSETLRAYNDIIPQGADRLLRLIENQSEHRQSIEAKVLDRDARRADWGVWTAFALAFTAILSGSFLVFHGHDWAGLGSQGLGIGTLVYTFIYGTNSRREERQTRAKLMTEPQGENTEKPSTLAPRS